MFHLLSVDALKIDKSFIDTVGTDSAAWSITAHIIEIGKSQGAIIWPKACGGASRGSARFRGASGTARAGTTRPPCQPRNSWRSTMPARPGAAAARKPSRGSRMHAPLRLGGFRDFTNGSLRGGGRPHAAARRPGPPSSSAPAFPSPCFCGKSCAANKRLARSPGRRLSLLYKFDECEK